jgi:hypothetical protein
MDRQTKAQTRSKDLLFFHSLEEIHLRVFLSSFVEVVVIMVVDEIEWRERYNAIVRMQ